MFGRNLFAAFVLAGSAAAYQCQDFLLSIEATAWGPGNVQLTFPPFTNGSQAADALAALTGRNAGEILPTLIGQSINTTGTWNISTRYCTPASHRQSNIVHVLTHGVGFEKSYWEIGGPDASYNYIKAATEAGYSTLSYDRLGTGKSSHPDPYHVVQLQLELGILVELTKRLRAGEIDAKVPQPMKVVHIGHSYGSILTNALTAATGSSLSDGIILTGFTHNSTWQPLFNSAAGNHLARENQPWRFAGLNSGYITWGDIYTNQYLFLKYPYFDPNLAFQSEATKEPFTIGEGLTLGKPPEYYHSEDFTGPVFFVEAQYDQPFCGGNCTGIVDGPGSPSFGLFPNASSIDVHVEPRMGHGINMHYGAQAVYALMLGWVKEHVG